MYFSQNRIDFQSELKLDAHSGRRKIAEDVGHALMLHSFKDLFL